MHVYTNHNAKCPFKKEMLTMLTRLTTLSKTLISSTNNANSNKRAKPNANANENKSKDKDKIRKHNEISNHNKTLQQN